MTHLDWEKQKRRAAGQLAAAAANSPALSRANFAPTEKQYKLMTALAKRAGVDRPDVATRREAAEAIERLISAARRK